MARDAQSAPGPYGSPAPGRSRRIVHRVGAGWPDFAHGIRLGLRISNHCGCFVFPEANMNNVDIFREAVLFHLGAVPVTRTMMTTAAVSFLLVAAAAVLRWSVIHRPLSILGVVGELSVEWLDQLVLNIVGHASPGLVGFSGALFYFIAACAVIGQLPEVRTPTSDLATTSALAIIVFVAVPVSGIRSKGLRGYLRSYVRPNVLMLPLHVMSELSRTFALSVRLFGNMMS
jgi:F-type H+-transporting ATPase subunit a